MSVHQDAAKALSGNQQTTFIDNHAHAVTRTEAAVLYKGQDNWFCDQCKAQRTPYLWHSSAGKPGNMTDCCARRACFDLAHCMHCILQLTVRTVFIHCVIRITATHILCYDHSSYTHVL